jgi:hypothetical protein
MITAGELARALFGLKLLLRFDGRAWGVFERTPRGFLTSFTAAAVIAPLHFLHTFVIYDAGATTLGPVAYAVVKVLSYVISWTLFPFAMIYLTRLLDRESRYFWHIVPYNWFQLAVGLPLYAIALLADAQALPEQAFALANLAAMVAVAIYATFIAAVGLRLPVGTAMSLVVLDFVLAFLANGFVARI